MRLGHRASRSVRKFLRPRLRQGFGAAGPPAAVLGGESSSGPFFRLVTLDQRIATFTEPKSAERKALVTLA